MPVLIAAIASAQTYGAPPARPTPTPPATVSLPAASPATSPAGRSLKDLQNTTITYYDVQGTSGPAIQRSWKKLLNDPASKEKVELFGWKIGTQVSKRVEGEKCTVESAKSTMTATVHLPRLAEESKVSEKVLTTWQKYVGAAENDAAASLWFLNDGLSQIDRSMVGQSCDQANATLNAGIEKLKTQLAEFTAKRAEAAAAPKD